MGYSRLAPLNRVIRHLRANVVGYLALFVALGGSSYAAVNLGKNSVGARQLKKNAVTSSKVKDGSLLRRDLRAGEVLAPGQAGALFLGKADKAAAAAEAAAEVQKKDA